MNGRFYAHDDRSAFEALVQQMAEKALGLSLDITVLSQKLAEL